LKINGKELRITLADFQSGIDLQNAFGKALIESKINLDGIVINKDDPLKTDIGQNALSTLINSALTIGISKELQNAIFKCAERCLLGEDKINWDFFEKEENREYYFPIMIEIAKVNLAPFVKGLLSMFGGIKEKFINILK